MPRYIDITGQRYGRLVAIKKVETQIGAKEQWLFQCDCGKTCIARKGAVRDGRTRSCGCLGAEIRKQLTFSGCRHNSQTKSKMRDAKLGKKRTPEAIEKSRQGNLGRKNGERQLENLRASFTDDRRAKLREAWSGKSNPNFIDGNCAERIGEHRAALGTAIYGRWRQAVYLRDNYTCQMCGQRGGELHADHILPFSQYPKLWYETSNGRTLCVHCHRKTPTYGRGSTRFALQNLGLVKQS